jgi:hypothetical protein
MSSEYTLNGLSNQRVQNNLIKSDSIVAVHGLGANPNRTWTYRQDVASKSSTADSSGVESNNRETMWLKDLLPQQVPMSRIMTFNYASEWLRDAPRESMRPLASRLLANIDDVRQEREVSQANQRCNLTCQGLEASRIFDSEK